MPLPETVAAYGAGLIVKGIDREEFPQLLEIVYTTVSLPPEVVVPLRAPVELLIVASDVFVTLQTPPDTESLSVTDEPGHTESRP